MKKHRSKNALTLQSNQRGYLPTITEGQPIDIGIIASSLNLPFPIICQNASNNWHIEGNTNNSHKNVLETTRLGNVEEEFFVTTAALSPISGLDLLTSASNPAETTASATLPPGKASPQVLADQQMQKLEWATAKILAQPERALAVYRRMRRRKTIRQVSLLDDLIRQHSCQECGVTLSRNERHECCI